MKFLSTTFVRVKPSLSLAQLKKWLGDRPADLDWAVSGTKAAYDSGWAFSKPVERASGLAAPYPHGFCARMPGPV